MKEKNKKRSRFGGQNPTSVSSLLMQRRPGGTRPQRRGPRPATPTLAEGEEPAGAGRPSPVRRGGKRKGNPAPPLPGGEEARPASPGQGGGYLVGSQARWVRDKAERRDKQRRRLLLEGSGRRGRRRDGGAAAPLRRRRAPRRASGGAEPGVSPARRLPLRGPRQSHRGAPRRGDTRGAAPRPPAVPEARETGAPPSHAGTARPHPPGQRTAP